MKYSISFRRAARHSPSSSGKPVLASMNLSSSSPNRSANESVFTPEEACMKVEEFALTPEEVRGRVKEGVAPATEVSSGEVDDETVPA